MTNPRASKSRFEAWRERQHADPEYRAELERATAEIAQIDEIMRRLDQKRDELGMSKTELADLVGKNPSAVRRLFAAETVNPELKTITSLALALGGRVTVEFPPTDPPQQPAAHSKRNLGRRATAC